MKQRRRRANDDHDHHHHHHDGYERRPIDRPFFTVLICKDTSGSSLLDPFLHFLLLKSQKPVLHPPPPAPPISKVTSSFFLK